jgi:hypothetical protein
MSIHAQAVLEGLPYRLRSGADIIEAEGLWTAAVNRYFWNHSEGPPPPPYIVISEHARCIVSEHQSRRMTELGFEPRHNIQVQALINAYETLLRDAKKAGIR